MQLIARISIQHYLILKALKVMVADEVKVYGRSIRIGVDDKLRLWISKLWFSRSLEECVASLMHEAEHVLCLHPVRVKALVDRHKHNYLEGQLWLLGNVSADLKVWQMLWQSYRIKLAKDKLSQLLSKVWVPNNLIVTGSVEEIFEWLLKNVKKIEVVAGVSSNDISGGQFEIKGDVEVLNEGRREFYEELEGAGDAITKKEVLEKYVGEILYAAKMAGATLTFEQEYVYKSLFEPKVDWRVLFRNVIRRAFGDKRRATWMRESRRIKDWIGYERYGKLKVLVLCDASGSITNYEFEQFMSEVKRMLREDAEVRLVIWDTKIVREYDLKRVRDVELKVKYRAEGGTRFAPIIREKAKELRKYDMLIVLTDGCWFNEEVAENELRKLGRIKKVLVTTERVPCEDVWWAKIKINLGGNNL